jgi:hypothetical protein
MAARDPSIVGPVRSGITGILLGISLLSCGGAAPAGPPAVTASELIDGLCTLTAPCCRRARRDDGGKQCRSGMEALVATGVYDPRAGAACMTMLRASNPEALCELVSASESPCQAAIGPNRHPGTRRPGETCAGSADCAGSPDGEVECRQGSGAGWCELQVRGKEGDGPCIGTVLARQMVAAAEPAGTRPGKAFLCYHADDLQCDVSAGSRCARPRAAGATCQTDADCGKDAYCRAYEFVCRALKPLGASCNPEVSCVDEGYCPLITHTCTAWLAAGSACTTSEQCHSERCEDGICGPQLDPAAWPLFLNRFCGGGAGDPSDLDGGRSP